MTDWFAAPGATTEKPEVDIEGALMVLLEQQLEKVTAVTLVPHDYKDLLAAHEGRGAIAHVTRTGGGASRKTDEAQVSVRGFTLASAEHPRSSHKLLGAITRLVEAVNTVGPVELPADFGGGKVLLDAGEKISGPVRVPWLDDDVQIVECIYRMDARRQH